MYSNAKAGFQVVDAYGGGAPFGRRAGRALVALSVFCSTQFPPFFWFNQDHAGSAAWPIHARCHLVWNACVLMAFGVVTLLGLAFWWEREPKIRAAVTAVPLVMIGTYLLSGLVVAPALLGVPDGFQERTPIVLWDHDVALAGWFMLMAFAVIGYLLDRRARRLAGS